MNYKERGQIRKHNQRIIKIFQSLKFKSLSLSFPGKIILVGSILLITSLFLPWVKEGQITWNSFHSIAGNIGYFLIFIIPIQIFVLLSHLSKEKIQMYSNIRFRSYFLIITIGSITILSSIMSLSFINGLQTFYEGVTYGNGSIFTLISGLLITFGGLFMRKEYQNDHIGIFIDHSVQEGDSSNEKNNMKLPF